MLIGIAGPARGGKDTIAEYIISRDLRYVRKSFADPIKAMLKTGLGLTDEQLHGDLKEIIDPRYGRSPRYLMQTLGTEWGRDLVRSSIWVRAMASRYPPGSCVIVPDVRFKDEARFVRERGLLIHVMGRGLSLGHASEVAIEQIEGDRVIYNTGTLDELYDAVDEIPGLTGC